MRPLSQVEEAALPTEDFDDPEKTQGVKIELKNISFKYPTRDIPVLNGLNMIVGFLKSCRGNQVLTSDTKGRSRTVCSHSRPFRYIYLHTSLLTLLFSFLHSRQPPNKLLTQTGCGKTSIISLLERFYTPQIGSIISNGHEISRSSLSAYRSNISLVAQEASLFSGTIRENILLGVSSPLPSSCQSYVNKDRQDMEAKLSEACRAAGIEDFILSLPEGFDTAVGAKGVALSGVCFFPSFIAYANPNLSRS